MHNSLFLHKAANIALYYGDPFCYKVVGYWMCGKVCVQSDIKACKDDLNGSGENTLLVYQNVFWFASTGQQSLHPLTSLMSSILAPTSLSIQRICQ